ncbi:MAG: hypothetical protein ABIJ31_10005 [Pseudomonadota bacterium]
MNGKILNILMVVLMLSGIACSGYLWYQKMQKDKQIVSLHKEIQIGNQRFQAAQKKYNQEKAGLNTCMRLKLGEENQNRKLQKEVSLLMAEKDAFVSQTQALKQQFQAETASMEKKNTDLKKLKDDLDQKHRELAEKYRTALGENREHTEQISVLESEKHKLESILNQTEKSLERSLKHNQRLCVIAEELTGKYREKAGKNAEPFTKLKMVELEHLIQDYIKQIDKEKIIEQ